MKKVLEMLGVVLFIAIALAVGLVLKAASTPSAPERCVESIETGGAIEEKYIKTGPYGVSCFEQKTEEAFEKYEIYYPAELERTDKKYPVVVFVNGTGVTASKYKALFEHLASWGFIVIGNEEQESWNGIASEKSIAFLLQENEDEESKFHGKIDTDNIGASGHSQGGVGVFTTITEHEHSKLFKTAVALSPTHEEQALSLQWKYDLSKITVPIMLAAGTQGDFETKLVIPIEKMIAMWDKINAPKVMMRKTGYDHGQMLYAADGYATAWFMWQLQKDEDAAKAFTGDHPEIMNNKSYQDQKIDLG